MVLEARRGFAALKQRASSAPAKRARAPTPPVDVDVLASEEVWTPSGSAVTSNEDEPAGAPRKAAEKRQSGRLRSGRLRSGRLGPGREQREPRVDGGAGRLWRWRKGRGPLRPRFEDRVEEEMDVKAKSQDDSEESDAAEVETEMRRFAGDSVATGGWRRCGDDGKDEIGGREVSKSGWVRMREAGVARLGFRLRYVEVNNSTVFWFKFEGGQPVDLLQLKTCDVSAGRRDTDIYIVGATKVVVWRLATPSERDQWLSILMRAAFDRLSDYYEVGRRIGVGTYGEVFEAKCKDTGDAYAVKTVNRRKVRHPKELEFIRREIEVIAELEHPNIVKAREVFDDGSEVHFVMEILNGGDLFDAIANEKNFSEQKAGTIIREILEAVAYLHEKDIVHRDLKPENILCQNREWPLNVKLADFGTARFSSEVGTIALPNLQLMSTIVGTPFYLAPEVLDNEKYSFPVDLWACGVILYAMIAGKLPWPATSERDYCAAARHTPVAFPEADWSEISSSCKSMIRQLLTPEPALRLTARQALGHPWLVPETASLRRIPTDRSLLSLQTRPAWSRRESFLRVGERAALVAESPRQSVDREREREWRASDAGVAGVARRPSVGWTAAGGTFARVGTGLVREGTVYFDAEEGVGEDEEEEEVEGVRIAPRSVSMRVPRAGTVYFDAL